MPDLEKLSTLGSQISKVAFRSIAYFEHAIKINPNSEQVFEVFGIYTRNVLNDNDKG
jgi:hypothetical protein